MIQTPLLKPIGKILNRVSSFPDIQGNLYSLIISTVMMATKMRNSFFVINLVETTADIVSQIGSVSQSRSVTQIANK